MRVEVNPGAIFGRWKVVRYLGKGPSRSCMYLCRCECGTERSIRATVLNTGRTKSYNGLEPAFKHESINHSAREFARGNVTTNGIESFNALLKRGILGVYHHVSPKHLPRYVNEFSFRLNEGNVRNHTTERLDSLVRRAAGKRLTYEDLKNA